MSMLQKSPEAQDARTDFDFDKSRQEVLDFVDAFTKQVQAHGMPQRMADAGAAIKDRTDDLHHYTHNAVVAMEKQQPEHMKTAMDRAEKAAVGLVATLAETGKGLRKMLRDKVPGAAFVMRSFEDVLDATQHYTAMGKQYLSSLVRHNPSAQYALGFLSGYYQAVQLTALEQRKKGVRVSLKGPMAEFVLDDARHLGMIQPNKSVHRGTVLSVFNSENRTRQAVIETMSGKLHALPVPADFPFKSNDRVVMRESATGVYTGKRQMLNMGMER